MEQGKKEGGKGEGASEVHFNEGIRRIQTGYPESLEFKTSQNQLMKENTHNHKCRGQRKRGGYLHSELYLSIPQNGIPTIPDSLCSAQSQGSFGDGGE